MARLAVGVSSLAFACPAAGQESGSVPAQTPGEAAQALGTIREAEVLASIASWIEVGGASQWVVGGASQEARFSVLQGSLHLRSGDGVPLRPSLELEYEDRDPALEYHADIEDWSGAGQVEERELRRRMLRTRLRLSETTSLVDLTFQGLAETDLGKGGTAGSYSARAVWRVCPSGEVEGRLAGASVGAGIELRGAVGDLLSLGGPGTYHQAGPVVEWRDGAGWSVRVQWAASLTQPGAHEARMQIAYGQ